MKITDELIQKAIDAGLPAADEHVKASHLIYTSRGGKTDRPAWEAFTRAALEAVLPDLTPAPALEWIPAAEVMPAFADTDGEGYVIISTESGDIYRGSTPAATSHWLPSSALAALPKRQRKVLTPEDKFNQWWEDSGHLGDRRMARIAFLAALSLSDLTPTP